MLLFLSATDPVDAAFEVLRLGKRGKYGVITPLCAVFDLHQFGVGVGCCGLYHAAEHIRKDVLGAGAGDQITAIANQLHSTKIDLLVPAKRGIDRGTGLGEGRRIEDDDIVLFTGKCFFLQQVKDVGGGEMNIGKVIQLCVFGGTFTGVFTDINAVDIGCVIVTCVQGKAAGVGEAVKYFLPFDKGRDGSPVFLLIEEETGLLSVLDIDQKTNAVFADLSEIIDHTVEQTGLLLKTFQIADGSIVTLPDAAGMHFLNQRIDDDGQKTLHAEAHALEGEDTTEAVHNQTGKTVGLGIDESAGIHIRKAAAVIDGAAYALPDEAIVDALIPEGKKTKADLGHGIVERTAEHTTAGTFDGDHVTRLTGTGHTVDIAFENPGIALQDAGFLGGLQIGNGHKNQSFFVVSMDLANTTKR